MRKITFGITLILFISAICLGQSRKADPNSLENEKRAPAKQTKKSDKAMENSLIKSGTSLDARLQSTLDVKKSKVGDEVILKTTKTIKENGQVIVPKGTRLIGRITEIQKKTNENAMSRIGVVFESIEGKNLSAPISASVVSVSNVSNQVAVGDMFGTSASGNSNSSATTSGGGGGLLGGATQTVGGVLNSTTQAVGGATNTLGQNIGGVTQTVGGAVNGIQINQSANASAGSSTTFSTPNRNLRIEKGANFQLVLNNTVTN